MEKKFKSFENDEFKEWMRHEWNYSVHTKYRHLFEVWWNNITESQIYHFKRQMYNLKHNVLGKTSNFF